MQTCIIEYWFVFYNFVLLINKDLSTTSTNKCAFSMFPLLWLAPYNSSSSSSSSSGGGGGRL